MTLPKPTVSRSTAALGEVLSELDWSAIQRFIKARAGVIIDDNRPLAEMRIRRRMEKLQVSSLPAYLKLATQREEEAQILVDLLTTHETYFFREAKHFAVLHQFVKDLPPWEPIRIWSAACSTGEEPYSIAMTLYDALGDARDWSVVGTDVSVPVLEQARAGIYRLHRLEHLGQERLTKHCQRGRGIYEGSMRVKRHITQRVEFEAINLHESCMRLRSFQAIFLRNVLIYFSPQDQQDIIRRMSLQLVQGGLLFLGKSELVRCEELPLRLLGNSVWKKE